MNNLKPCPFCGCSINLTPNGELVAWHKSDCFFQLLEEQEVDMTQEQINAEFVKSWNRRVNDDRI